MLRSQATVQDVAYMRAMIPEAFEDAQPFIGLITVVGFLSSFLL